MVIVTGVLVLYGTSNVIILFQVMIHMCLYMGDLVVISNDFSIKLQLYFTVFQNLLIHFNDFNCKW